MIDTHCLICFKPLQENKSKETNNGIQSNLISDKNILYILAGLITIFSMKIRIEKVEKAFEILSTLLFCVLIAVENFISL